MANFDPDELFARAMLIAACTGAAMLVLTVVAILALVL